MPPSPHFLQPLFARDAGSPADWGLYVADRNIVIATQLEGAFDSTSRNKGLLGRDGLAPGTALIIAPSNGVHTFAMRFPIDLIFAGRDGTVVKLKAAVPKSRIAFAFHGFAVIELAAGSIAKAGVKIGDRLAVRRT